MADAPDRVWITEFTHGDRSWTDNEKIGKYRKEMEYIRADIAEAEIERLRKERDEHLSEFGVPVLSEANQDIGKQLREAEAEIERLRAEVKQARVDALEEAAREADKRDLSIMSMTHADATARAIATDIRALIDKEMKDE